MNFSPLQIGTRPAHAAQGLASAGKADALDLSACFRSLVDVLANGGDEGAPRSDALPADGDHLLADEEDPQQPQDLCSSADSFAPAPAVVAAVQSAPIADWAVPPPVAERRDEPVEDGHSKGETGFAGREIRKPQPPAIRAADLLPAAAPEREADAASAEGSIDAAVPEHRPIQPPGPEIDAARPAPERLPLRAEAPPVSTVQQSATPLSRNADDDSGPAPARAHTPVVPALLKAALASAHESHSATVHVPATPHVLAPGGVALVAPTGAALTPPAAQSVPDATISEIVRVIRLQASGNGGEARIRLEPNHFGELTVAIRVEQNQVVARLQAESPLVREWLQTNQGWLRQQLAEHQLTLDRFEVIEPASDSERADGHGTREEKRDVPQRDRRRQQDAESAERFEVLA